MNFLVRINKLLGSVSDRTKSKFIVMEGAIELTFINYGDKTL